MGGKKKKKKSCLCIPASKCYPATDNAAFQNTSVVIQKIPSQKQINCPSFLALRDACVSMNIINISGRQHKQTQPIEAYSPLLLPKRKKEKKNLNFKIYVYISIRFCNQFLSSFTSHYRLLHTVDLQKCCCYSYGTMAFYGTGHYPIP